jgi:hypothetical protein
MLGLRSVANALNTKRNNKCHKGEEQYETEQLQTGPKTKNNRRQIKIPTKRLISFRS